MLTKTKTNNNNNNKRSLSKEKCLLLQYNKVLREECSKVKMHEKLVILYS
jgi:hypothetical protein